MNILINVMAIYLTVGIISVMIMIKAEPKLELEWLTEVVEATKQDKKVLIYGILAIPAALIFVGIPVFVKTFTRKDLKDKSQKELMQEFNEELDK